MTAATSDDGAPRDGSNNGHRVSPVWRSRCAPCSSVRRTTS
jgi:hypothetical protein